jgi:hypothetical protein
MGRDFSSLYGGAVWNIVDRLQPDPETGNQMIAFNWELLRYHFYAVFYVGTMHKPGVGGVIGIICDQSAEQGPDVSTSLKLNK